MKSFFEYCFIKLNYKHLKMDEEVLLSEYLRPLALIFPELHLSAPWAEQSVVIDKVWTCLAQS